MTAMIMTHTHAKGQGERSLGSKVKTGSRRTNGGDCIPPMLAQVGYLKLQLATTVSDVHSNLKPRQSAVQNLENHTSAFYPQ